MELFKYNRGPVSIELVCSRRDTRNGFAHDCHMFIDGQEAAAETCYYLNRTWERYDFQSVILKAVGAARDAYADLLRRRFKDQRGYMRMTPKREAEFKQWLVWWTMKMVDVDIYHALGDAYGYFENDYKECQAA